MTTTFTEQPEVEDKSADKKASKEAAAFDKMLSEHKASKPSVNLVPRYITDRRAAKKTTRQMMYTTLVVFGLVVFATLFAWSLALKAESTQSEAEFQQAEAQRNVDTLRPIADYYDGLVSRKNAAADMMRYELDHGRIMTGIQRAAGSGVQIRSVTMEGSVPCAGPNPFVVEPALGCLTLTASSPNMANATGFVDALNSSDGLFSAAFASAYGQGDDDAFNVTVNYSTDALSLRFVPKAEWDQARADALAQANPAPTPDPAAAPAEDPNGATP